MNLINPNEWSENYRLPYLYEKGEIFRGCFSYLGDHHKNLSVTPDKAIQCRLPGVSIDKHDGKPFEVEAQYFVDM
jgi:hypothetical protein